MKWLLQLMILCLAVTAQATCVTEIDGFCADEIATLSLRRGAPAKINVLVAMGSILKVRLPPGATFNPSAFAMGSQPFAHRFDDTAAPTSFFVWPRQPKRGNPIGLRTNVQFELSGQAVILDLKVAPPGQGAQQLIISFPQLETELAQKEGLRVQIRAELEEELAHARANLGEASRTLAEDQIIDAAFKRLTCSASEERGFDRYLRLTTARICAFGEWIFIEATLDNGRRKDFELRDVAVDGVWGAGPKALDFKVRWVDAKGARVSEPLSLHFGDAARAMFLVKPPPGELPDAYRITIHERGGLKRTVVADDIEF